MKAEIFTYKGFIFPANGYGSFTNCNKLKSAIVMYNYNDVKFLNIPIIERIPPEDPIIRGIFGSNLTYAYNYTSSVMINMIYHFQVFVFLLKH